jgi:hypothetical protein
MPTLDEIRAAIKAKIEGVGGVGVVHDYERYAKEPSKFKTFYVSGNPAQLLGWHIRRVTTRELLEDIARWRVVVGWRIRGFMGIADATATEKAFDLKIELIRDAFRADDSLGGLIFSCIDPQSNEVGVQVLDHRPVLLHDALCHFAELGLTTQHLN